MYVCIKYIYTKRTDANVQQQDAFDTGSVVQDATVLSLTQINTGGPGELGLPLQKGSLHQVWREACSEDNQSGGEAALCSCRYIMGQKEQGIDNGLVR